MPIEWTGDVRDLAAAIEFDPETRELTIWLAGRVHTRLELDDAARVRLARQLLTGIKRAG
jgi:DNA-binding transcriptional regulator/RsmH inhibitor MraZ